MVCVALCADSHHAAAFAVEIGAANGCCCNPCISGPIKYDLPNGVFGEINMPDLIGLVAAEIERVHLERFWFRN